MKTLNKVLLCVGSAVVVGAGTYLSFFKNPPKYSEKWIENLTSEEWRNEREKIQQLFLNPKLDFDIREQYHNLLRVFDKVKSKKDWAGEIPHGPAYHREHGFNLYKPD